MITVLTLVDHYLPGSNAGGALRSVANLVETLGDDFRFRLVTRDRDWLSDTRYPGIHPGRWETVGLAEVMYLEPSEVRPSTLRRVIRSTAHDVLYLNSLFSRVMTLSVLAYRRLGALPPSPLILAPRGQLSPGALDIRGSKKTLFLRAARAASLYDGIWWQASSSHEEREIREHFDRDAGARVLIAPDLPTPWDDNLKVAWPAKQPGKLHAVFVSRIDRKKNLHGAIDILGSVAVETTLEVFGSAHDIPYLRRCQAAMRALPAHIRASYSGALPYDAINATFARHDVFFFPTHGENFGHVVVEALAAGCPVIVSDRTPFRDLDEWGAGWVVPLEKPDGFRGALEACGAMGPDEHARMRTAAREYARRVITDPVPIEQNRRLFAVAAGIDSPVVAAGRATQNIA